MHMTRSAPTIQNDIECPFLAIVGTFVHESQQNPFLWGFCPTPLQKRCRVLINRDPNFYAASEQHQQLLMVD